MKVDENGGASHHSWDKERERRLRGVGGAPLCYVRQWLREMVRLSGIIIKVMMNGAKRSMRCGEKRRRGEEEKGRESALFLLRSTIIEETSECG